MENDKLQEAMSELEENQDLNGKWLTFWMDRQLYGVSIAGVEQIVQMQPMTEVPDYPAYAKGVINLRGNIIPLVDLRMRLGKPVTEYTDHTCIIINLVQDSRVGFIVDEVDAVIDIPPEMISDPPRMGEDTTNRYLIGVARLPAEDGAKERIVLCLDGAKVLRQEEFNALVHEC